jgi:predicted nucleic acid-binding protein
LLLCPSLAPITVNRCGRHTINPTQPQSCTLTGRTRRIEELEAVIAEAPLTVEAIPREALFLAGKVFLDYRRRRGSRHSVLPDFYIGAHAAVQGYSILTRDTGRYRSYYPTVALITPS